MKTTDHNLTKSDRYVLTTCRQFEREIANTHEPAGFDGATWAEWARDRLHGPQCGGWWYDEKSDAASKRVFRAVLHLEKSGLAICWRPWRGRLHLKLTDAGTSLADQLATEAATQLENSK